MEKVYKFITIKPSSLGLHGGKQLYVIINNKSGDEIGYVCYYSPWRQYCFRTYEHCIFNVDCLLNVIDFIKELKKG